jgi:hypothetical protein
VSFCAVPLALRAHDHRSSLLEACDSAATAAQADAADLLFVAAAANNSGNDNDVNPVYPSSYPNDNILSTATMCEPRRPICSGEVSVVFGASEATFTTKLENRISSTRVAKIEDVN